VKRRSSVRIRSSARMHYLHCHFAPLGLDRFTIGVAIVCSYWPHATNPRSRATFVRNCRILQQNHIGGTISP
ncbi:MAG: hypothetical protein LAT57_08125, partial [Balneolales bacterium]|nr:hypothetical protein [Balneolales bacterium]